MKLALCQLDIVWEDKQSNLVKCTAAAAAAARAKADLVIFPEMSLTGFSMESAKIAEPLDGLSVRAMQGIAAAHTIRIIFGLATVQEGKHYNTLVCLDTSGEIVHTYNKIHPFSYGREDKHYSSGDQFRCFEIDGVPLAGFICYDLRFPELFTHLADCTKLYVVIANWPDARVDHWKHLLRARALDTFAFVAGVNRVGTGGNLRYTGDSLVFDPWGRLVEGSEDPQHSLLFREIDVGQVEQVRKELSLLDDRRWSVYASHRPNKGGRVE
ncbi:MAG: carbon-nitrogen family hydrolase [Ignavibacteria bacterium]|nr:carbon-nitrogen family hydrolase [Ignavibacteria bacterium]